MNLQDFLRIKPIYCQGGKHIPNGLQWPDKNKRLDELDC